MKLKKITPSFMREDQRGLFVEAINGTLWKNISYGKMKKGGVMGNHYHKKTKVFFFVAKGAANIDVIDVDSKDRGSILVSENEGIILAPNHSHAINFLADSIFIMGKSLKYIASSPDTYEYKVSES